MADRALLVAGEAFVLPPGATPIAPLPLSAVPLGGPGVLGLAMAHSVAVPVFGGAPGEAWVLLETPGGQAIMVGDALLDAAPPGARLLAVPRLTARPAPPPGSVGGGAWSVPMRSGRALARALAADCGGPRLVLPFAALEHVVPLPALSPAPGARDVALGYALADGAPVLVLDPARLVDGAGAAAATLLVIFRHAGRRLGLPCARIAPARAAEPSIAAVLDALLPLLGAAPLGQAAAPPAPEPTRALLLCAAGGHAFALPVGQVAAVIPPLAPAPAPGMRGLGDAFRGLATHRGEVLPVLDAGIRLGLPAVFAAPGMEAPMLRLATTPPVALAVSQVAGLRRVPDRLIADVAGEGPVGAIAALADAPLPICRAAVLGAL